MAWILSKLFPVRMPEIPTYEDNIDVICNVELIQILKRRS